MSTPAEMRLRDDLIIWMTTVNAKGMPQPSPVWFIRDGDDFVIYSMHSARLRNIERNPSVALNLDGDGEGEGIVVVQGTARIEPDRPAAYEVPAYVEKYARKFEEYGWDPVDFSRRYPVPVVVTPTRIRAWFRSSATTT